MPKALLGWLVSLARGRQNKIDGPSRTFAKSQTHPPTSRFFFLGIFFSTFSGVSRQGEFKNTITNGFTKSPCRKLSPKNRQNFEFFLDSFCFIAVSGVSQRWEFKNTTKNVLQKNRVEKFLQKKRKKIQNRFFFDLF
jgi:hypothetical protein